MSDRLPPPKIDAPPPPPGMSRPASESPVTPGPPATPEDAPGFAAPPPAPDAPRSPRGAQTMRRARATRSGWGIAIAAIIGVRVLGSIISGTDNGSSAVPAQTFVQPPLRLVMLPLTIDDAIPITSQKVRGAISRIEAGGERVKAQFYGVRGDHPSFMLVVVSMPPGGTPDDIFRRVTDKIPGGKRVGKISRTASNGITYLCTQVDGKQPGSLCMWIGPQDSGYLRAYEPGGHPLERIARVRRNTTL